MGFLSNIMPVRLRSNLLDCRTETAAEELVFKNFLNFWRTTVPSTDQIIVWMIIGLLGGSFAGLATTWNRSGYGFLRNLGLGLIGALVGGWLFRMFGLFPNLGKIVISLRDIVAAFVGSLIVLVALWRRQRSTPDNRRRTLT